MFGGRRLIVLSILILLALSLVSTFSTAMLTVSVNTQTKSANGSSSTFPSEMKIVKETDFSYITDRFIGGWLLSKSAGKITLIEHTKEYNSLSGTYYYTLKKIDINVVDSNSYDVTTDWQIVFNTSLVWYCPADLDGDGLYEMAVIPNTKDQMLIYDDDGTQLRDISIPEQKRAPAIIDWTGDGVEDVVLIEGSYKDLLFGHYLKIRVFDIYSDDDSTSRVYIGDYFAVGEAFVGDWDLSLSGMEVVVLETSLDDYGGDSHSMVVLSPQESSASIIDLPYEQFFSNDIALSFRYIAFSYYDENVGAYGIAVFYNGSIIWSYSLPTNVWIYGMEIAELDGDTNPEFIVITSSDIRVFDIENKTAKITKTASYGIVLPLDFNYDGVSEVILFQDQAAASKSRPDSEWFSLLYWRPRDPQWHPCVLLNSTTLDEISDVILPETLPEMVSLFAGDFDGDSWPELFGVSPSSSKVRSIYSIVEAISPVLDIVSPANGSYVGDLVDVVVLAFDNHSGIDNVTLFVDGVPVDYYEIPSLNDQYLLYWDAEESVEGPHTLKVVAYDKSGNLASKEITVYLDKTPPVINAINPENKSWVGGVVEINVSVDDPGSSVSVVYFGAAQRYGPLEILYNDTEPPYVYSWDTRTYAEGVQYIIIAVWDNAENCRTVILEYYVDNTPPTILAVQYPDRVKGGEEAKINITATDTRSGVEKVILSYSFDGGKTWVNLTATAKSGDVYEAVVPGQTAGTTVQFKIIAIDEAGNIAVSQTYSYEVVSKVALPSALGASWTLIGGIGAAAVIVAVLIVARRRG